MAADETMATATGDSPSSMAGRVKPNNTTNANTRPMTDRKPRHAATATMARTNTAAHTHIDVDRAKSKNE